ncbi:hypothetical protein J3459_011180 [Metarhizium acridum]|nr:hypothetical protein J3459_011180 [Metarhizium acridum]
MLQLRRPACDKAPAELPIPSSNTNCCSELLVAICQTPQVLSAPGRGPAEQQDNLVPTSLLAWASVFSAWCNSTKSLRESRRSDDRKTVVSLAASQNGVRGFDPMGHGKFK